MKKRLCLKTLEVKSFVTDLNKVEKQTIEGGTTVLVTPAAPAISTAVMDVAVPFVIGAAAGLSIVLGKDAIDNSILIEPCTDASYNKLNCPDTHYGVNCISEGIDKCTLGAIPGVFQDSDNCPVTFKCKRCY